MKRSFLTLLLVLLIGCKGENRNDPEKSTNSTEDTVSDSGISIDSLIGSDAIALNLKEANKLVELPLACVNTEYPNKLGQTLASEADLKTPQELHPAFYGCFDWHSSVHAHWSLVRLLKEFPKLDKATEIKGVLQKSLSKENIQAEVAYFKVKHNDDYERTYGWAWLLKLDEELRTWDTDLGLELSKNMQPLTSLIASRFEEFLPKLNYPIRVGEHSNTAFALSFAHDYAVTSKNDNFLAIIEKRAKDYYLKDDNCPFSWEPSGFDFLSPCLEEVDIMRKVLPKAAFDLWIQDFMPDLKNKNFELEPGEVSDRTDGKLVHIGGLNFSRAWVLYGLTNQYPEIYGHLRTVADNHVSSSFSNITADGYEGGHWLSSFALYALQESQAKK